MANDSITKQYDELPFIARVILQLVFGLLISGVYRILRFIENNNLPTLIAGIIGLFTGIGNFVFWWVDLITLIMNGKYTLLVD